jgi:peptide-methionine (R)-S-oxide reductase
MAEEKSAEKIQKSEEEWKAQLSPEEFHIMRQKGTERPFTGKYYKTKTPGMYLCNGCGQELFNSETKYESGSGWPSFWQPVSEDAVELHTDRSLGLARVEVTCSRCGAHLGHVFTDGPQPTGQRFCMNSASLRLEPK